MCCHLAAGQDDEAIQTHAESLLKAAVQIVEALKSAGLPPADKVFETLSGQLLELHSAHTAVNEAL